jgi:hypothetical protein
MNEMIVSFDCPSSFLRGVKPDDSQFFVVDQNTGGLVGPVAVLGRRENRQQFLFQLNLKIFQKT